MQSIRYAYWQDGDAWLGHLEEYPDYLTQGESLADLAGTMQLIWGAHAARVPFSAARRKHRSTNFLSTVW